MVNYLARRAGTMAMTKSSVVKRFLQWFSWITWAKALHCNSTRQLRWVNAQQ
jgi:hypothetical protein